jgi:hypothetical protein
MTTKKTSSKKIAGKKVSSKKRTSRTSSRKTATKKTAAKTKGAVKRSGTAKGRKPKSGAVVGKFLRFRPADIFIIPATETLRFKAATTGRLVKSSPASPRLGEARIEAAVRAVVGGVERR